MVKRSSTALSETGLPDGFSSVSLAMEAIGDITASAEVSRVSVVGEEFDSRIQGGVLVSILLFLLLHPTYILYRATASAVSCLPCSQ